MTLGRKFFLKDWVSEQSQIEVVRSSKPGIDDKHMTASIYGWGVEKSDSGVLWHGEDEKSSELSSQMEL